ncbi:serine hydrolase domain-containing protein [Henriciella marina]|uniref:serine hydrolase domain-containing protein n=1 Tax=Henriciella marina TaxID=453851 RepID=UPI000367DE6E|nr:serine hydrolase domain-containing protein [Henriciella marina]
MAGAARLLVLFVLMPLAVTGAHASPITEHWLQTQVDEVRAAHDVVALGAGIAVSDGAPIVAVSGTVSKSEDTLVAEDDAWHIGSNTKALTALLYARLVEDERASWDAGLVDLFGPDLGDIDPAWTSITVRDLFAHRSGVGQIGPMWLLARHNDDAALPEQRFETARSRLAEPPRAKPGAFEYSNLNYIIAGAAIEIITGMSWEDAFREILLVDGDANLADGWGFGPPQTGPVGHKRNLLGMKTPAGRGASADNPGALGPAGTAHAPLASHVLLLQQFLYEDGELMTDATRQTLLSPWPDETADYALGWGVGERDSLGRIFAHQGSNTMWLSHAELVPSKDAVFVVNANEFSDASRKAVGELVGRIETRLAEESD